MGLSFAERVYAVVRTVPVGCVTTYGAVATLVASPRAARAVGGALRGGNWETPVPWQRVINAQGRISFKGDTFRAELQRVLLETEGVVFDREDRIDLSEYGWWG